MILIMDLNTFYFYNDHSLLEWLLFILYQIHLEGEKKLIELPVNWGNLLDYFLLSKYVWTMHYFDNQMRSYQLSPHRCHYFKYQIKWFWIHAICNIVDGIPYMSASSKFLISFCWLVLQVCNCSRIWMLHLGWNQSWSFSIDLHELILRSFHGFS